MAWTTPTTVNPGDAILSSLWNEQVRDNLSAIAPDGVTIQSWSPAFTGTWANGNATVSGEYYQIGKLVTYWGKITIGSTTTKPASGMEILLPVEASDSNISAPQFIYCVDQGVAFLPLVGINSSTTKFGVYFYVTSGSVAAMSAVTSTQPFTWATADEIWFSGSYIASA